MFKRIYYDTFSKKIHLWESYNGKTVKLEEPFEYQYYTKDLTGKSEIKDIYGNPVKNHLSNNKKNIQALKDSGNKLCEFDIAEDVSYLQRRYGKVELNPNIDDFNIAMLDIEIESGEGFPYPEQAEFPINLISVYNTKTKKMYTWGNREYTGNAPEVENYAWIPDEVKMLTHFVKWWRKCKFDAVTGWYVKNFDIQYIINRLENLGIKLTLSPINKFYHKNKLDKHGKTIYYCKIAGLNLLDYKELYEKFTFDNLPSYSLNFVTHHEKLGGKLELEGHINDAFLKNWNKYVEYNVQDVLLIKKLEEKKKFIALAIQLSSEALIPVEKVVSSVATIEGYVMKHLHMNNMVMPDKEIPIVDEWKRLGLYKSGDVLQNVKWEDGEKTFYDFFVKGGHVDANRGLYNDVESFDVESLYPHNIMQYNISPDTKVFNPSEERIAQGDLIKTPLNGLYYTNKKKGIFPVIVKKIFDERRAFKKKMFQCKKDGDHASAEYFDSQQHIRKIMINSIYGVMASKYFHFYDVDNARVVTRAGRELIKFLSNTTNRYFKSEWHKIAKRIFPDAESYPVIKENVVKLIDTDSNYLCFSEIKEHYAPDMELKEFGYLMEEKVLDPFYDKILLIWAKKHNTEQIINFKREGIISKQLVLAKKKYLTLILQNEDEIYEKPKLKATGSEMIKSDVPLFCRQGMRNVIDIIFEGKTPNRANVMKKMREIKKDFKEQKIEDISFNKGVKEYSKYAKPMSYYVKKKQLTFKKSTPIHIRASMCYNYMITRWNLPYVQVNDGAKIKYIHTTTKNNLETYILGYIGNWPKEFNDKFTIDYKSQFDKSFVSVIQKMFDVLKWGDINFNSGNFEKFMIKKK